MLCSAVQCNEVSAVQCSAVELELAFIKREAGVSRRAGSCVVDGFSAQVVAGEHVSSKRHQQLDQVNHVASGGVVQGCLVELHRVDLGTCRKVAIERVFVVIVNKAMVSLRWSPTFWNLTAALQKLALSRGNQFAYTLEVTKCNKTIICLPTAASAHQHHVGDSRISQV